MENNHAQALNEKHARLENQIHEEEIRPVPDDARLAELKKAKLKIKDELLSMENVSA